MKFSSLLTLLSTLGACALIFICLLGGYDSSTLPSIYMFNLNTSKLSHTRLDNNTGNGCNCVEFVNGTLVVNNTAIQNIANGTTNATYLGIGEDFRIFTINLCTGRFLPDYQDDDASLVLTNCKHPSLTRRFDLERIVEDALTAHGLSTDDINWPNGITNAFLYYHSSITAIIAFFITGAAFALVTSLASLLALVIPGRTVFMALLIFSALTLLCLAVAGGVATTSISTVVNGINSSGEDIGISADQGNLFLGLIWSSVALLFIATLATTIQLCTPGDRGSSSPRRRRDRYTHPKGPYDMMPLQRHPSDYYYPPDPYSSRRSLRGTGEEGGEEDDFR